MTTAKSSQAGKAMMATGSMETAAAGAVRARETAQWFPVPRSWTLGWIFTFTNDSNAWHDDFDQQWGNGLEIWFR